MSHEQHLLEERDDGRRRCSSDTESVKEKRLRKWKLYVTCVLIILLVIGATAAISCYLILLEGTPNTTKYAIVFDAGSTGSRMFIYQWDGSKTHGWNNTPVIDQIGDCNPEKSLSTFENDPSKAGSSLERCFRQAMDTVPAERYQWTRVYLAATGGMRLLRETNSNAMDAILASVRSTLKSHPFVFRDDHVRVLSELEEGVFAWMTVNYLNVKLGYTKKQRGQTSLLGAIDMGGASVQISFVPAPGRSNSPGRSTLPIPEEQGVLAEDTSTVRMFGNNYSVYSSSFLCYGKDEAYRRLLVLLYKMNATINADGSVVVQQPCAQRNTSLPCRHDWMFDSTCTSTNAEKNRASKNHNITFIGTGDPSTCAKLIATLLTKTCPTRQCPFNEVHAHPPKIVFLAFSGFFYTYEFYNFTGTSGSPTFEWFDASVLTFCIKTWDEVLAAPPPTTPMQSLSQLCFDGLYVIEVLKALGFNSATWTDIIATETMSGTTVDWTLGLLLTEIDLMPPFPVTIVSKFPLPAFVALISLLSIVFVILLALFVIACRRRPTG